MQTPNDMLGTIKTRSDFRQAIKSEPPLQSVTPVMDDLWLALSDAYGSAFVTQFGDSPNPSWMAGLGQYSPSEIRRGFDMVLKSGSDYAPNLSSLVRCIDSTKPQRCHKIFTPENKLVDMSSQEENKKIGASALFAMKGMF
jgi:hypothetical protein